MPPAISRHALSAALRRTFAHSHSRALALGAAAVLSLSACTAESADPQALYERAESYREGGNLQAAIIEYKNYLIEKPDDLEARWRLGEVYMDTGQPVAALKELDRASPLARERKEVLVELVRAQLRNGESDRARRLLERWEGERDADIDALAAEAALVSGDAEQAGVELAAAAERNPQSGSVQLALARLALSQGDREGAQSALDEALSLEPDNIDALLLQGELASQAQDWPAAERAFEAVLAESADQPAALAGLAGAMLAQNRIDDARPSVERLQKLQPNSLLSAFLGGVIAYSDGQTEQAKVALNAVINAVPGHPQARLILGELAYREGAWLQAEEHLRNLSERFPGTVTVDRLLASSLLRDQRPAEAVELLQRTIRLSETTDPALYSLLSAAQLAAGEPEQARKSLERAQELAPDASGILNQEALVDIASGDLEAAATRLQAGRDALGGTQTDTLLAYVQMRRGENDAALDVARSMVEREPDSALAHNLLGLSLLRAGQAEEAEASMDRALELDATFVPALLNKSLIALSNQQPERAREQLQRIVEIDPGQLTALRLLARLATQDGDLERTRRWLQQAADRNPRAAEPRWGLAALSLRTNNPEQAYRQAQEAAELTEESPRSAVALARVELATGRGEQALETLQAARERWPEEPGLVLATASFANAAGDVELARSMFQQRLEAEPTDLAALWGNFRLELQAERLQAAKALAESLRKAHPERVEGDLARAELALAEGRRGDAATALREGFERQPSAALARRLALVQQLDGKREEAKATLLAAREQFDADNPGITLDLAQVEQQLGDDTAAAKGYREVLERFPDNVMALNNLAWIAHKRGDAEALGLAERALRNAPDNANVADTVAVILLDQGEVERAFQLLVQATRAAPEDPDIRFHYAQALAAKGERNLAREVVEGLLEQHPRFSEREAAEQALGQL